MIFPILLHIVLQYYMIVLDMRALIFCNVNKTNSDFQEDLKTTSIGKIACKIELVLQTVQNVRNYTSQATRLIKLIKLSCVGEIDAHVNLAIFHGKWKLRPPFRKFNSNCKISGWSTIQTAIDSYTYRKTAVCKNKKMKKNLTASRIEPTTLRWKSKHFTAKP